VQCIVLDKGETTAFVHESAGPRQLKVKVGRSNEKFVEVLEGLAENQEVLLAPPPGFVPAQAEDKPSDMPKAAAAPPSDAQTKPAAMMGQKPATPEGAPGGPGRQGMSGGEGGRGQRPNFDPSTFDPSKLEGRMKERWDAMSEEQRTQFLENMRSGKFPGGGNGGGGPGGPGGGNGGGRRNRDGASGGGNGDKKPADSPGGGGGK
jgi:hypothetical protein